MSATTRDLLAMKNSAVVFTCAPEDSVAEACRVLRDRRVGCLVVVRDAGVEGLLSERDVVTRVVAQGLDPAATRVRDVMEQHVATVPLDAPCRLVETTLRDRRARYLPVVGSRGLLGVVSLGDLARFHAARERDAERSALQARP
jgi:CBS domain-containing protein